MSLGKHAYVDPVLPEDIIEFQLPAVDTVGIPPGQSQGFIPCRPSTPCCDPQLQRGQFSKDTHELVGPEGRVRTDVKIFQVNSTHALRGRLSGRLEISPMGDWLCSVGATRSLGLDCESFFFALETRSCLWHTRTLGADFAVLPMSLHSV